METKLKINRNSNEAKGKLKKKFMNLSEDDLYNEEDEFALKLPKKTFKRKKELINFNRE